MKRASLTLYFSLLAVLLMALFFSLLESARVSGLQTDADRMAQAASSSVFAEYNRELLDRYELFALDGSCGSGSFEMADVEHRMEWYLYRNAEKKEDARSISFYPLQAEQVQMSEYQLLTDNGGDAYFSMACRYAAKAFPLDVLQKVQEYSSQYFESDAQDNTAEIEEETDEAQKALDTGEGKGEEKNPDFSEEDIRRAEEVSEEDKGILEQVKNMRQNGILSLLTGESSISQASIDGAELLSERTLERGTYQESVDGGGNMLLFQAYLNKKFGRWGSPSEDTVLEYEQEYLLAGKKSDPDNLEAVALTLLAVREGANFVNILKDETRREEARIIALAISGAFALPGIYAAIFAGVMLAMAFLDSIADLQKLFGGDEVQVLDIEGAPSLDYSTYLQLLLLAVPKETLIRRSMNLIEQNIRQTDDYENFRLDFCIVRAHWNALFQGEPMFLQFVPYGSGPGSYQFYSQGTIAYE